MSGAVVVRGVPNQPESASRSAPAAASAGSPTVAAQAMWASGRIRRASGEIGREGAGQGVAVGIGRGVADVGSGDHCPQAAQGLLVGEQFGEEFPERFGGRVVSAPQCHLSLSLQHRTLACEVAFVVIGVEQAGRCPTVDVRGELPGEVDRVKHAGVDADAGGGKLVSGVTGQQDAAPRQPGPSVESCSVVLAAVELSTQPAADLRRDPAGRGPMPESCREQARGRV